MMPSGTVPRYDARSHRTPSFAAARTAFSGGSDDPRRLLERCLAAYEAREPDIHAFVAVDLAGARAAADAATARYRAGTPLSAIDGMPVGLKDTIETADLPTQMGSPFFKGYRSHRDAACVAALRRGGAVIVGKTVATEFAYGRQRGTRNPFDRGRTPGTSSSGSTAAVAAGMLPAALGTQLKSSILRPSSYCGCFGYKPSWGTLSMAGIHPYSPSGDHLGTHAGTLDDAWVLARFISEEAGPEPGRFGLDGPAALPDAARPARLLRLYTPGWGRTVEPTKQAFEAMLDMLRRAGVDVVEPAGDRDLQAIEDDTFGAESCIDAVAGFEMRWLFRGYRDRGADLGDRVRASLARGDGMTRDDYHAALRWKAAFRDRIAAAARRVDGFVMPSACGPAPVGLENFGDPVFGTPATCSGAPSVGLPLLTVDALPQGVTLMGFADGDAKLMAHARWVTETILGRHDA
jgi:Asp-tRNA(Asn)/Glu-tRNA(Gln) amidotransferase A subunit family amidase